MSTMSELRKMTGNDDVYRFSSGNEGTNNPETGGNNPDAGKNNPDADENNPLAGQDDARAGEVNAVGGGNAAPGTQGQVTTGESRVETSATRPGGTANHPGTGAGNGSKGNALDERIKATNASVARHQLMKERGVADIDGDSLKEDRVYADYASGPDAGRQAKAGAETGGEKAGNSGRRADGKAAGKDGGGKPDGLSRADLERKALEYAEGLAHDTTKPEPPRYEAIPAPPKRDMTFEDIYKEVNPGMSDEEIRKKEKAARIENLFNAIGDGISAIAAIHATGKGALNTFHAKDALTARQKRRMDEWEKKVQAYRDGLAEARRKDAEMADKDYKTRLEYINARNGLEGKLADYDLKLNDFDRQGRKDAMQAYLDLLGKKITREQFEERMKETVRHNKETESIGRGQLGVARENASTNRARLNHQVAEGDDKEFLAYDKAGKAHRFKNGKAAEQFSRREGTWDEGETVSTSSSSKEDGVKKTTVSKKTGSGYSKRPAGTGGSKKTIKGFGGH